MGDITSSVKAVLSLFDSQGAGTDAQVLAVLAELQRSLTALRIEMHARFDIVDTKLDTMYLTMIDGLAAINNKAIDTNTKLDQVRQSIARIDQQVGWLSWNLEAWLSDLSRQDLNQVIGLAGPILEEEFKRELSLIFNYVKNTTVDSLHAGPASRDYLDQSYDELKFSLGYNVNYLANYPTGRFDAPAIYGQRLANPSELVYALQMYLSLTTRYPAYAANSAATIRDQAQQMLDQRVKPISAFISSIQGYNGLFDLLAADYRQKAMELQLAVTNHQKSFLLEQSAAGQDMSIFDVFGGIDQTTTFVPLAVRLDRLGPCSGTGPTLTLPDNWKLVFDNATARNAEALGLGNLSSCYSFDNAGEGGWSNLQLLKIKTDRYWAWGTLNVRVSSSIDGSPVSARLLVDPVGSPYARDSICFYFTTSNINIAPSAVPAASVLGQAWEGTFQQPIDWCSGFYAPSNLKVAFETRSVPVLDWTSANPTKKAEVEKAVAARLQDLKQRLLASISNEMQSSGPVGLAAKRLTASKLVIQRYLELALPDQIENNYPLRSLFYGTEAMPDDSSLASQFLIAAQHAATVTALPDVTVTANAKADQLSTLLAPVLARIRAGQARESISDLAAVQVQLDLLLSAMRSQ